MRITFTVQFDQPENDQVLRATISGQSHGFGVGLNVLSFQEWSTLIERFLEEGEIHLRGGASVSTFTDPVRNPSFEGAFVLISLPGHESNAIPQLAWWTLLFSVGQLLFKPSSTLNEVGISGKSSRSLRLQEAIVTQLKSWQFQGEYRFTTRPGVRYEDITFIEAAVETTIDWCPTFTTEMQHTLIWGSATGLANGSHFSGREMIGSIPVPSNNRSEFAEYLQCLGLWGKKIPATLFDLASNSHLPAADFIHAYHRLVDLLDQLAEALHIPDGKDLVMSESPLGADWFWQLELWGMTDPSEQFEFSLGVIQRFHPNHLEAGEKMDVEWLGKEVPLCVEEIMTAKLGVVIDLYRL
jgi:hypothetical protein